MFNSAAEDSQKSPARDTALSKNDRPLPTERLPPYPSSRSASLTSKKQSSSYHPMKGPRLFVHVRGVGFRTGRGQTGILFCIREPITNRPDRCPGHFRIRNVSGRSKPPSVHAAFSSAPNPGGYRAIHCPVLACTRRDSPFHRILFR